MIQMIMNIARVLMMLNSSSMKIKKPLIDVKDGLTKIVFQEDLGNLR